MNRSLIRALILKDLYLCRWIVGISVALGLLAVAILPLGTVAFYIGSVSVVCVLIVLNVFLVTFWVVQERKDKTMLFVLSLPISTSQYLVAKMASNFIAFFVPWLMVTVAGIVMVDLSGIPNGYIPFMVTILVYILSYYCVLLSVALVSDSMAWTTTVIITGNVSVNFMIPLAIRFPSVADNIRGATAQWGTDVIATLAIETALGIVAMAAVFALHSKKKDFI
jgi:ABC-2 type transport system permease protein